MSETLPKDPVMLLSFINLKLRDFYPSLDEFCKAFNVNEYDIRQKLETIDYVYDSKINQFICLSEFNPNYSQPSHKQATNQLRNAYLLPLRSFCLRLCGE